MPACAVRRHCTGSQITAKYWPIIQLFCGYQYRLYVIQANLTHLRCPIGKRFNEIFRLNILSFMIDRTDEIKRTGTAQEKNFQSKELIELHRSTVRSK